jgi:hypothetical protein
MLLLLYCCNYRKTEKERQMIVDQLVMSRAIHVPSIVSRVPKMRVLNQKSKAIQSVDNSTFMTSCTRSSVNQSINRPTITHRSSCYSITSVHNSPAIACCIIISKI